MTVRSKMDSLMNQNPNYRDLGIFRIDGRKHGYLEDSVTKEVKSVYESKDDIDDDDNPEIKVFDFNFGDFLSDNFDEA